MRRQQQDKLDHALVILTVVTEGRSLLDTLHNNLGFLIAFLKKFINDKSEDRLLENISRES